MGGGMPGMPGMGGMNMPAGNNPLGGTGQPNPFGTPSGMPPLPNPMMDPALLSMLGNPGLMGGMTGMAPGGASPAAQGPPEERFEVQLRQLQEMGFFDREFHTPQANSCAPQANTLCAAREFLHRD